MSTREKRRDLEHSIVPEGPLNKILCSLSHTLSVEERGRERVEKNFLCQNLFISGVYF
jgi:hypothetical protein